MEFRLAGAPDIPAVTRLLAQLGYPLAPEQVKLGEVVLAVEDRPLALAAINTRWHIHRACLVTSIDAFVVDEAHRSRGVGHALLDEVTNRAARAGARLVDLHSNLSRTEARRFYERHGFEVTSNYFVKAIN